MTNESPKESPKPDTTNNSTTAAAATAAATAPAATDTSLTEEAPGELTAVVDELLDSLSTKFASVSSEIFEKIEVMSKRLDAMEASLQQSSSSSK